MKKVLYVTPLVVGFQDILEGNLESRGLPSFILPLKKMLESSDYDVHIVLVSNFTDKFNIKVDWLKEENIVGNINNDLTTNNLLLKIFRKAKSSIQLIKLLLKLTKENDYDVIYCHGKAAVWGNVIANIRRQPCAYRLYGTSSYYDDLIKFGKFKGALKNMIYTIIFKLPKKFIMITDDGSHGDKVYEMMKPKKNPYPLHFLLNGVDHQTIVELDDTMVPRNKKYIFHAGRIDPVKRQDRNIEVLKLLRDQGYDIELYLAGHYDTSTNYYQTLMEQINKYQLQNYVHFLGPIQREMLKAWSYHAVCTLLMGDIANNGSVFYEVFSTGSIIVGLDGEDLRQFIDNEKNGYLIKDNEEAVIVIKKILDLENEKIKEIRENAINVSKKLLLSWEERINKEIEILFNNCV